MLSSSCCERLSLISLTKEKPVVNGPGAEEMEGWEKRLLEFPMFGDDISSGVKWRWERCSGGRERTYSWKFRDARLVVGSRADIEECLEQYRHINGFFFLVLNQETPTDLFTCVTGARLRGVTTINRRSLFIPVRRLQRWWWWELAILISALFSPSSHWTIFIIKVFLQPGGNDTLNCVRHPTDETRLLLMKRHEKNKKD